MTKRESGRRRDRPAGAPPGEQRQAGIEGNRIVGDTAKECDICHPPRTDGGPIGAADGFPIWVCADCQRQSARGVNSDEAKGG